MYELFLDLDGVLADFDSGVKRVTGSLPHEQAPGVMWRALARTPAFYEHLDWLAPGREIWETVAGHSPTILTGLPRGNWAEPQKRAWCRRELGPDVPVITCWTREKPMKAREVTPAGKIPVLIDDRSRVRDDWEAMGGIFILHDGTRNSLDEYLKLVS